MPADQLLTSRADEAAPHTLCHVALAGETECARGLSGGGSLARPSHAARGVNPTPQVRTEGRLHHAIHHPCQVTADPARRLRGRRIRGVRGNRSDVVREPRAELGQDLTYVSFGLCIGNRDIGIVAHGRASGERRHRRRAACCHLRPSLGNVVDRSVRVGIVRRDNCTYFGQSLAQAVFVKAASMSEPASYAFTLRRNGASVSVLDYDGANATQPIDASSGGYTQSSRSLIAPGSRSRRRIRLSSSCFHTTARPGSEHRVG